MENTPDVKPPSLPLRLVRLVVGGAFYLSICAFIFGLIMLLFAPGHLSSGFGLAVPIHVSYRSADNPTAALPIDELDFASIRVGLVGHSTTQIAFDSTDEPLSHIVALPALAIVLGFIWIAFQLRCILAVVADGRPFDREIPQRLRRLAYLAFALWPVELLLERWVVSRYSGKLFDLIITEVHPERIALGTSMPWNLTWPMAGLAILVAAQIFDEGARLWEEQQLTV